MFLRFYCVAAEIREYFGEAICLYFTFLGFYTTALLIPLFLGCVQLLIGAEAVPFFCVFNVVWVTVFLEVSIYAHTGHNNINNVPNPLLLLPVVSCCVCQHSNLARPPHYISTYEHFCPRNIEQDANSKNLPRISSLIIDSLASDPRELPKYANYI